MPPRTVVRTRTIPVGISLPQRTTTRYVTLVRDAETVTETATVTQTVRTPRVTQTVEGPESKIILTRTEFVGYSALFVAGGILATILVGYALFALGWLRGDGGNRKFIREIRDELKY
jgi:hypothetical protein